MLLNLAQTAERLGTSETNVKRLMEGGSLPNVPYGNPNAKRKAFRFDETVIRNFKKRAAHLPVMPIPAPTPTSTATPTASAVRHIPAGFKLARDAAQILGWKKQRVYDLVKNGRLAGSYFGRTLTLSDAELEKAKTMGVRGHYQRIVSIATNGDLAQRFDTLTERQDKMISMLDTNGNNGHAPSVVDTDVTQRLDTLTQRQDKMILMLENLSHDIAALVKIWA